MRTERAFKRALAPVTTPGARRWLIQRRNAATSAAAAFRGAHGGPRLQPSFLIAGVQKGGTTFLYQELVRHPQVLPALTKEVHYFSDHYVNGATWYQGFFPPVQGPGPLGPVITGEASPCYVFHPWFPERVARDLPDAKVIVVLRDPVKRAFSQYLHERRLSFEPAETFAEALALENERTGHHMARLAADPTYVHKPLWHHTYRLRGHYREQLERLHQHVPPERVLVLVSEELYADPGGTYDAVCAFLGVSRWRPPAFGTNDMAAAPVPMDESCRRELTDYFAPRNAELAAYLGRELPWTSP